MENGQKTNGSMRPVERYDIGHVQEVIRQAHGELRQLLQQRAEIMKRIGTVKQTISGLANLFGDELLSEELMELVDRKNSGRQPGFTKACRMILMEGRRAMNAHDICDYFQQKMPALLARPSSIVWWSTERPRRSFRMAGGPGSGLQKSPLRFRGYTRSHAWSQMWVSPQTFVSTVQTRAVCRTAELLSRQSRSIQEAGAFLFPDVASRVRRTLRADRALP